MLGVEIGGNESGCFLTPCDFKQRVEQRIGICGSAVDTVEAEGLGVALARGGGKEFK